MKLSGSLAQVGAANSQIDECLGVERMCWWCVARAGAPIVLEMDFHTIGNSAIRQ